MLSADLLIRQRVLGLTMGLADSDITLGRDPTYEVNINVPYLSIVFNSFGLTGSALNSVKWEIRI